MPKSKGSRKDGQKCPRLGSPASSRTTSTSAALAISKTKLAAYESLKQDNTSRTDPRMTLAGKHFMGCDGIEALHLLVGRQDQVGQHTIADDARKPKRSLHRSAYPLARFLSLHVADKPNRLGAAVGRRMMFGKLFRGRSLSSVRSSTSSTTSHDATTNKSVKVSRRIRASWHVSPLMFRIIVAFTKAHTRGKGTGSSVRKQKQVGGRYLGTGRNETRVYTFDDIAREHPRMHSLCMHMYASSTKPEPPHSLKPLCFSGRDASHVLRLVSSSATNILTPFLAGIALKDILDEEDAGTEIHLHQRIHRWFTEVHSIHLTCLHPDVHFIELDERVKSKEPLEEASEADNGSGGHKLLVTRLLYGDAHHLALREEEITDLSMAVLEGLVVFHNHHYLHMDIKPDNILWDLDNRGRRVFCLSDYNLAMSDTSLLHFLRPDDGGGFQSLSHGTEGYKSPLLMVDDLRGNTYRTFDYVAAKSRAFPKNAIPVWREYFERSRGNTSMAKVDLHSLALTLIRLALPRGQDKKETLRLLRGPLGRFLAKLLFFRPHDFMTASDALTHLRTNSRKAAERSLTTSPVANQQAKLPANVHVVSPVSLRTPSHKEATSSKHKK